MQLFFGFYYIRVKRDAINRTHFLALRRVEMADTFRAKIWVNHINLFALRNGTIRALWLANIAVDALVGNH